MTLLVQLPAYFLFIYFKFLRSFVLQTEISRDFLLHIFLVIFFAFHLRLSLTAVRISRSVYIFFYQVFLRSGKKIGVLKIRQLSTPFRSGLTSFRHSLLIDLTGLINFFAGLAHKHAGWTISLTLFDLELGSNKCDCSIVASI